MKVRSTFLVLALALALALPGAASATTITLGSTVEPAGATAADCSSIGSQGGLVGQTSLEVGTGGGLVTSWSVNATGDGTGTETLYVLAPNGSGYTVVGTNTGTLPAVIPADGTVTFPLASPIMTQSGDIFALSASGGGPVNCAWTTPDTADQVFVAYGAGSGAGQTITPLMTTPGALLDLAVTLAPSNNDVAVSTTAGPSNAVVDNEALLSSTVTNNGPNAGPATFTDAVPAGLAIDAAAATGGGSCTTAGQVVTCTFASLAVGASAPVEIVVTPVAAQSYQNTVFVADPSGATDPNPANNSATATLVAATSVNPALSVRECVAANLKGLSEKVAKRLLPALGCKVGKVKKAASKTVAKGDVISLKPGSGSHAAGTKVALTVSSGKPKKKHKG
jgi:Domain of unknown function DUF11/PASTA domain